MFLFPSFDSCNEDMDELDTFMEILEESGVYEEMIEACRTDRSKGGRLPFNLYKLFAVIVYAFPKHSGSVRKIEESLDYDLRFI